MNKNKAFAISYLLLFCFFNSSAQNKNKQLFTLQNQIQSGITFTNSVKDIEDFNALSHPNHWNGGGVAIGDINNDGLQDIYFSGNEVGNKLYLNKGDLKFQDITKSAGLEALDGWNTGVTTADVNADGWLDIYVCRSGLNSTSPDKLSNLLFINNGNLTFSEKAAEYGLNDKGVSIHASFFDYDHYGLLD